MKLTTQTLKHPTTRARIDAAMRTAMDRSRIATNRGAAVANTSSGAELVTVLHLRNTPGAFWFFHAGVDVTKTVLEALRAEDTKCR